ncbi:MAG: YdeI/OmpD-associated family protein [Myxococcota bacterium]|nr:YdeI/OmpD-associated family protein [Deltaproteobacteria bacterium]MDQ3334947.1 YdeI/OmpD-associated family protein [Myxococcota bacterium]
MDPKADDPILPFATSADFARWLAKHHRKAAVVWIKYAKKGSGQASITWGEAVDVALCYGWIDGQAKPVDERYYLQRFTPRRAASKWSKINRERVARLIAAGRMRAAGLAEVERAKEDGRWDAAYDSPKTAAVPDDLALALEQHPAAKAAFDKLGATPRYAFLHRLQIAKQAQTRARHIATIVTTLEATKRQPKRRSRAGSRAPRR